MNRGNFLDKDVYIKSGVHAGCKGKVVGVYSEKSGLKNDLRVLIVNNMNPRLGSKVKCCNFKLTEVSVAEEIKIFCYQHKENNSLKWFETEEQGQFLTVNRRRKDLDQTLTVTR